MKISTITLSLMLSLLLSAPSGFAQSHDHSQHMNHDQSATMPTEPGQGAFASIAEIVELLVRDPETDWSKVSIEQLREHLVQMNDLVLNSEAEAKVEDKQITFIVSGEGRTKEAIQAMVPAHSIFLANSLGWEIIVGVTENGAVMQIAVPNQASRAQVLGLGFYGVMALGGKHHQFHHLAMAKGQTR